MDIISSLKPREKWDKIFDKGSGIIVDLGCGYGADAYFLAKKGYKVFAVDKKDNLRFSHKNLIFLQQDLDKFVEGEFDGVIANFSLHFLKPEKRIRVVRYYLDKLRPEGIFYILMFSKFVSEPLLSLFGDEIQLERLKKKIIILHMENTFMI